MFPSGIPQTRLGSSQLPFPNTDISPMKPNDFILLHDVTKDPVSGDHYPCTHQGLDFQHIFLDRGFFRWVQCGDFFSSTVFSKHMWGRYLVPCMTLY